MIKKKDILEIKKRFKKDDCTFTKLCGCYVNSEKKIILDIEETFLNLDEDVFFKYLEIAKKTLSGTIGNNLLELNFPDNEEYMGEKQKFFLELKRSGLKNPKLLNTLYQSIIDNYEYEGNFLILLFHDAYDVMRKTSDNAKLDESEEVYEYIICAICPVSLSKAGLGYLQDENKIGARIRDWVVEMPSNGFVYPAFIDRSSDIDSIIYYTKNPKDPHPELMEECLGCTSKQTATEQKETFNSIIRSAIPDEKKSEEVIIELQENINSLIEEHEAIYDDNDDPVVVNDTIIHDILNDSGVSEEISEKIGKSYMDKFQDAPPIAEHLVDSKALAANAEKKKQENLVKQVEVLKQKLEETKEELETVKSDDIEASTDDTSEDSTEYDVVLNVKPEKVSQITSQLIDGKKCIIIPIEENEHTKVNGINIE